jgi:hypothetical protein
MAAIPASWHTHTRSDDAQVSMLLTICHTLQGLFDYVEQAQYKWEDVIDALRLTPVMEWEVRVLERTEGQGVLTKTTRNGGPAAAWVGAASREGGPAGTHAYLECSTVRRGRMLEPLSPADAQQMPSCTYWRERG